MTFLENITGRQSNRTAQLTNLSNTTSQKKLSNFLRRT